MNNNNVAIAEAYYTAMGQKNIADAAKYLHPDVQFTGPIMQIQGKEEVMEAIKRLTSFCKAITIRAKFGSGNQAMVAYTIEFPAPIGNIPTAALLTFQDGLIAKVELFFDGSPFKQ